MCIVIKWKADVDAFKHVVATGVGVFKLLDERGEAWIAKSLEHESVSPADADGTPLAIVAYSEHHVSELVVIDAGFEAQRVAFDLRALGRQVSPDEYRLHTLDRQRFTYDFLRGESNVLVSPIFPLVDVVPPSMVVLERVDAALHKLKVLPNRCQGPAAVALRSWRNPRIEHDLIIAF